MPIFVSNSLYQHETHKLLNYARNMYPRAHLSGQGTCCLDIGFRHMSIASDRASFRARHVPCGRRKGNYEIMRIYFVGLCKVLLTADRRSVPGTTLVGPCSNQTAS